MEEERSQRNVFPMGEMTIHDYLLFLQKYHKVSITADDIVLSKQTKPLLYFDDKKVCKFKSIWTLLAGDSFGDIALVTSKAR